MKTKFDFIIHWLWAIVWALLAISGFGMVGAKYGWIANFNFAMADYIHRVSATIFVILTFISIVFEVARNIKSNPKNLPWFIFGKSGYQLFTFITTLIFIITGAIIWICADINMIAVSFALIVHEYISYLALVSVIWHIYVKSHALIWPKKVENTNNV